MTTTAGSGEVPKLQIVDHRIAELEEQLGIAKHNSTTWEAIARSACRAVELQSRALRRLRTPSMN